MKPAWHPLDFCCHASRETACDRFGWWVSKNGCCVRLKKKIKPDLQKKGNKQEIIRKLLRGNNK